MSQRKIFLSALSLILVSLATTSTRAQTKIPGYFLRERGVTRVQPLSDSLAALSSAAADQALTSKKQSADVAQSMKLDLFPDVSFVVNLDHVERQTKNDLAWFGNIEGAPYGQATFVLSGSTLTGAVTRGDGKIYRLQTADDGTRWAFEIDQSKFPNETDPLTPPKLAKTESADLQQGVAASSDDGSTIDVMVVYTAAARQAAGSTALMQQRVQLGIAETNQGYADSGVIQRVRLVETREINYTESSSISTDLSRLVNTTDGFLDDVLTLRNTYGADLVSLWVSTNESTCGIGYQQVTPSSSFALYGYSVAELDCATGYYTFGHEMGHNMGANHGRDDVDSSGNPPQGAYPYAFGFKKTTGTKFRTIMAYDTNCTCTRIDRWSNPDLQYSGSPMGIDSNSSTGAANYLVLNNTRTIVANFRTAITGGTTPPADSTGPQLTITTQNNQTISTSSFTISGTATDSGRGDSGISSVTVNGVRATNDTATGTGTASWSRTLTLNSGLNTITVIAKDNSTAQNSTTLTLTVTFGASTTSTTSATASTYHVFPQFADGRFSDGTYYRTTLMISNPSSTLGTSCTLQLRGGLTVPGFTLSYPAIGPSGWVVAPTSGTQNFQSGYATLQCSTNVEAQLLYSYYGSNGVKISEATVFSSPPSNAVGLVLDERDGARFAIAIANDSDRSVTYTIYVNATGFSGNTQRTVNARSSMAGFLGDLVSGIPSNSTASVTVVAASTVDSGSVIGLRFTGGVFTTMPASPVSSTGPTASTYHVFPQFADGRLNDGSYYRTSRLYLNPSSTVTADCTTRLRSGLSTEGNNTFTLSLPANTSFVGRTNGTQIFQSGYATLSCTGASVYAQAVYSFYASNGVKLSEATVFSSPAVQRSQILADNREGARVGIAIANDSDQTNSYTIQVSDVVGAVVGTKNITLAARTSTADFVDNFVPLPANYFGQVIVTSTTTGGTASIIGLRFTGTAFTTIPATIR